MSGKKVVAKNNSVDAVKQETVQEKFVRLETDFKKKFMALNVLKEEQNQLKEKIILAQDELFKSYQTLTNTKESLFINTINSHTNEINKLKNAQSIEAQVRQDNVVFDVKKDDSSTIEEEEEEDQ